MDAFFETVNAIFATILYTPKGEPNEAWLRTLFYLMVAASGNNKIGAEFLAGRRKANS